MVFSAFTCLPSVHCTLLVVKGLQRRGVLERLTEMTGLGPVAQSFNAIFHCTALVANLFLCLHFDFILNVDYFAP